LAWLVCLQIDSGTTRSSRMFASTHRRAIVPAANAAASR
jgi:hypothetical protein